MLRRSVVLIILSAATAFGAIALRSRADIDPLSGIDFAHIGAPGNAAWMGDGNPFDAAIGRGSVGYEYNIGRFEVTTSQWAEFMNAAFDRPANDRLTIVNAPAVWGAVATTPNNAGGSRWTVPAGQEMYAVGGISWRTAAMYCNWLHNGKSSAFSAFQNGAYDVSTFHQVGNGFTDQLTHNANAQYWIPTWDEWIKAAHYDPNRHGPGQAGYWVYSTTSNSQPPPGPPGTGQANYRFTSPNPFTIPLGAYTTVTSPWGLFDTAGATAEWTELAFFNLGQPSERGYEGSFWGSESFSIGDTIYSVQGSAHPSDRNYTQGFRVASSVPAPSACLFLAGAFAIGAGRARGRSGSRQQKHRAMVGAAVGAFCLTWNAAHGDIDPLSGIDFAHIGAPGNAAWMGDGNPFDAAIGRGSVGYEYNIGRFEVTTAQWVEFMNAAFDRPANDRLTIVIAPAVWGAVPTAPNNAGGARWTVPAGQEMYAVGGVSWRTAAMYCNWLCNGKSSASSAFQNGAYDVSTFHQVGNGFTDQLTHNANAQYWIPTWDEWLKAAHFDPNRNGPGQGGYWVYGNSSNNQPVYGPPGAGQANRGFDVPNPFVIPLGAYADVVSPWGLFDIAGGTTEWAEDALSDLGTNYARFHDGSWWTASGLGGLDTIYGTSARHPSENDYSFGLRLASSVPTPAACILPVGVLGTLVARRARAGVNR